MRGGPQGLEEWLTQNPETIRENRIGWDSLATAIMSGWPLESLHRLVQAGADFLHQDPDAWTSLHCAAVGGSVEVIEFLLKSGVSLSAKTKSGMTVLDLALERGEPQALAYVEKEL